MATSEEKQELVETLKGPRYYRVTINGYGGESAYMSISKEAHDFWKDHVDQYGDYDLVQYMVNAQDGDPGFEDIEGVPSEAEFMTDEDGDVSSWYESHTEFEHTYGATYDSAYITVDEVSHDAKHIADVIDNEDVSHLNDRILEESDNTIEIVEMGCCDDDPEGVEYIAHLYSAEKGGFFDGVIETVGDFDPKKLVIHTTEYLNGEDTITEVHYNGVEVENYGADTNGKGYYASVWSNVE